MKAQVKTKCDAEKKKKPQLAKLIITVRCSIYQNVISLRFSSAGALLLIQFGTPFPASFLKTTICVECCLHLCSPLDDFRIFRCSTIAAFYRVNAVVRRRSISRCVFLNSAHHRAHDARRVSIHAIASPNKNSRFA